MHRAQTVDILDDRARAMLGTYVSAFIQRGALPRAHRLQIRGGETEGFHCAPFHCDLQRRVKRTSVQSVVAQEEKRKVHLRFRISVGPSVIANCADIMHNNVEE